MQIFPSDRGNLDQPNGTFATSTGTPGNQLAIDINDTAGTEPGSTGVGTDSRYVFDDVFRVRNEGTQGVFVQIDSISTTTDPAGASGGSIQVDFFASEGADVSSTGPSFSGVDVIDGSANELVVPVGEVRAVGMRIETVDGSNYDGVSSRNGDEETAGDTSTTVTADADDSGVNNVDPGQPTDTR